jgi:HAE1 family hydrophobic/amphiphilic exporter-1
VSLPALCIRRPVFTVMMCLLPVVLGLVTMLRIGVDLFPNVDLPVVMITTNRPGTSVEEMETGVTKLVEDAVNTISGIDELRSTTTEGRSFVTVQFLLEKDRDVAQQEVQGKVNTILSLLPPGTETPIVDKFDLDASPVLTIVVAGQRDLRELTDIADRQIGDELSGLPGVGSVSIVGGRPRAVQIAVDARKLEAYDLAITDVKQALARQNLELPGGRVDQQRRELGLRTTGRMRDVRDFQDLIVADRDGQPVRVRDLGPAGNVEQNVEDGVQEPRGLTRFDSRNAVSLVVQKQSGSNTVDVIDVVKARIAVLRGTLDSEGKGDVTMTVTRDQSRFIRASMHEVEIHLLLGALLVVLSILLFLRDWRPTIVAAVTIPVSIIAVFPIMRAFGLTVNNITLIGMVLMIGVVVDDAVVVIENVFRWMEEKGLPKVQAAIEGTREITLAVLATSFSLFVIFLPIAFMSGTVGRFLRSFGIVCAVAILVSLLVSLTLTPMMSSRLLRKGKAGATGTAPAGGGFYSWVFERPYLRALRWSLRHRWAVVLATALSVMSLLPFPSVGYRGLFAMVGFDFIPKDDQSEFEVSIRAPEGWTLARTSEVFAAIERRLAALPGVVHVLTQIGDTSGRQAAGEGPVAEGTIYVRLAEIAERETKFTQQDRMLEARAMMADWPELRASVQVPAVVSIGAANADVEFQLIGPDLGALDAYSERIMAVLRSTKGMADVDTTLRARKPEVRIDVDRLAASDLGVSISDVASAMRTLVGGEIVTDYKDEQNGENYDVWLRATSTDRDDAAVLGNLSLRSANGGLVQLGSIAKVAEAIGPSQIDRAQRQRKISIIANLAGSPMGTVFEQFNAAFHKLEAPPLYRFAPVGRAKNQQDAIAAFFLAFLLSLVLMYMILAAQFESYVHPIVILLAVPLTIPFALVSLLALGNPLTLFSVLGLFLLFGIVKKNGILQIDFTNVLRRHAAEDPATVPAEWQGGTVDRHGVRFQRWLGRQRADRRVRAWAIHEANRVRLRPILMTTLMLIAAMIPIALGKGPGAANRADMAKVIVGGQALSLLLSLLVTPIAYTLFDDFAGWFRRRKDSAR